ncbi:hypothetical protein [Phaffia rhodozyma]|uniref:Uncharacterized protein n=1 Tax=Phaffia rhodozyma TaxID=264483 RepID=A0A0F7SPU1_PHARH|nr:hypothetical protein [Phaffia rhodozyma]
MQRAQQTSRVISRSIRPSMSMACRWYSSLGSSAGSPVLSLSPETITKSPTVHHGWPGSLYPSRKGLKKIAPRPSKEERKLQSLRSKEANKREAELDAFRRRNLQIFIEKFVSDSAKLPYPKFDKILCPPYVPPGGRDGKRDL